MKLIGHSELTTIEEPEQLQVILIRESGWIDLLAPPIYILGLVGWFAYKHLYLFAVLCSSGLLILLGFHLSGRITRLSVSRERLYASGNLYRILSSEILIPCSEVVTIGYSTGAEDDPSGLYVWLKRGPAQCVFPGLTKQQANSIADAIRRKFPDLEAGDSSADSLLFPENSGTIRLGL